jgi:hypothetical protein
MRKRLTREELLLSNHSRIVSLPCREETIRGYSNVSILVIDEAARVPDDVYRAVRPMLAVSNGRLICLSTPFGKRGFFYQSWAKGDADWARIEVPVGRITRIQPEFLAQERRALGESYYRQEYECSFESVEGLVYPDFSRAVVAALPAHVQAGPGKRGSRKGGIDFGFRNPFAALWGTVDRDGILWLTGEWYVRQMPLSHHAQHLPRDVMWYADPSGANEINELRLANFLISKGKNDLRLGIAAVSARLRAGTLRVLEGACPNLLAEAGLYRWGSGATARETEAPVDEDNHALAALRYLVLSMDAHHLARDRRPNPPQDTPPDAPAPPPPPPPPPRRPWLRLDNEDLWTPL